MYSVLYYSCPKTRNKYFFRGDTDLSLVFKKYRSGLALMYMAFLVKDRRGASLKSTYPFCATWASRITS